MHMVRMMEYLLNCRPTEVSRIDLGYHSIIYSLQVIQEIPQSDNGIDF